MSPVIGNALQSAQDPRAAAVFSQCRNPPAAGVALRGGTGEPDPGPREYMITGINDVVNADERWSIILSDMGNNADGLIGLDDGSLLIAQNSRGAIVKLEPDGTLVYPYPDTRTGGALSLSSTGTLFVAERALYPAILQVYPERTELANSFAGEPLHCLGGVLNDLTADSRGGVYFTMGGVFYAAPDGVVSQYGGNLRTNGIILSADERTLYVTNSIGGTVEAFDVGEDGALSNQQTFATLVSTQLDGLAIDADGRLYVTAQDDGIFVVSTDGAILGNISTPRRIIAAAFGGPGKKTLYAVGVTPEDGWGVEVMSLPMLSEGYPDRAK